MLTEGKNNRQGGVGKRETNRQKERRWRESEDNRGRERYSMRGWL
jgi:hypothetical protein